MGGEYCHGAADEVGDDGSDVGVDDVFAAPERAEPDRAVGLGPVKPARHAVGQAGAGAAADARRQLLLALGAEPFEQRKVGLFAATEVVVHEPAVDAGGARDVLDRDLVVGALGNSALAASRICSRRCPGARRLYFGGV